MNVPEGTTALRVEAQQKGGRSMTLYAQAPNGLSYFEGVRDDGDGGVARSAWRLAASDLERYDQTFARPEPGVWQFWMTHDGGLTPTSYDDKETTPATAADVSFKITAVGVRSKGDVLADSNGRVQATFTNEMSTIDQSQVRLLGIGAARDMQSVVTGLLQLHDVEVPQGATRLVAEVTPDEASGGHLGLGIFYISDNPRKAVARIAYDVAPGRTKRLEIKSPPAGRYRIAVDVWGTDAKAVSVKYRDIIFHPLYGREVSNHAPAVNVKRAGRVEAALDLRIDNYPSNGRTLLAEVGLFGRPYGHMSLPRDYYARLMTATFEGKAPPKVVIDSEPCR